MKTNLLKRVAIIGAACVLALTFAAENDKPAKPAEAADAAWQEVAKSMRPIPPPEAWRTKEPSDEEVATWRRKNGVLAGEAADKMKDFYTKHPNHSKAFEAQRREVELLGVAVQLGSTNLQARFDEAQEKRLKDPKVPDEEKFNLRAQRVMRILMEEDKAKTASALQNAEKALRELQEAYPTRDEVYELFLMIAQGHLDNENLPKARSIYEEVAKKASDDPKEQAQGELKKLDMLGKPLDLKFTSLAGKPVDLKDYAGKVVLIDFWATWCGPCRAALPEVKEIYSKYHDKGFEILGISFDKEKEDLTKFIAEEKLPWPQYFDGLGWENKLGQRFNITGIPTLWLVDKKGHLRDLNPAGALAPKIEKLLAEK